MIVTRKLKILAYHLAGAVVLLLVCTGCHGGSPVAPNPGPLTGSSGANINGTSDGRISWGTWNITIDPQTMTAEVVPIREGEYHYNVLHMLEGWACKNCVQVPKIDWKDKHTMLVDVSIRHPYPETRLDLTGRDVRGIAIFPGKTSFPYHTTKDPFGQDQPLLASRTVLNPDGYTTRFNRETSNVGAGMFDYQTGKFASPDESKIEGNLHPFKSYWTQNYLRLFYPGYTDTRTYELAIDQFTPFTFAYSIDASWNMPQTWPVTNPATDFSISAGSREAYQISMTVDNNMLTRQSGQADLTFDVFDHQGYQSISTITIEAPDLFTGVIPVDPASPIQVVQDSARYKITIPNDNGHAKTADGGSDLLIVVEDVDQSVVGEEVKAYAVTTIPVEDTAGGWRPRHGTFQGLSFPGPSPQGAQVDMSVISNPQSPWAIKAGDSMLLFQNDQKEEYLAYNRDFTDFVWLAGYPGGSNSFLKPVERLAAAATGGFGVVSGSSSIVSAPYEIKNCTNVHAPGGVYLYSWETGSEDDPIPHLELAGDVSGGFGNSAGDPIYSISLYDPSSNPTPPAYVSLQRIQSPYNDPSGVLRAGLPLSDDLSGSSPPYGVSYKYFVSMSVDDHPVTDLNPYGVNVYTVENHHSGASTNLGEMDVWDVNFADAFGLKHLKTYDSTMLGQTETSPMGSDDPRIVDVSALPAWANNMYTGNGKYATNNWVAVLYNFDVWQEWYIEVFDARLDNPSATGWQTPIATIGPYPGNAKAMDADSRTFELYVLADNEPVGSPDYRLSCFEYFSRPNPGSS